MGIRSSTPPFDNAAPGHPGEVLIQPSADSRLERARQVNPRAAVVAERLDKGFSDQTGISDCAVKLWACDILERVRVDFVPRLFGREGCDDDCGEEDDWDDPSVSTGVVLLSL